MLKLGVITPRSDCFPRLSRNFLDSVKQGLGTALNNIDLHVQAGNTMSRERDVCSAIQQLILEQEVELIVLPLNPASLIDLSRLIRDEGVPVVVCTLGENLIPNSAENELTFINSFHLWQCGWMLGYQAVKRFGRRVTLACSFNDGGYGISAAVDFGVDSAGGRLVNTLVSRRRVQEDRPFVDLGKLIEVETDVIVVNYSGQEAVEFFQTVGNCPDLNLIPLMSFPFGVEPDVMQKVGGMTKDVMSISTWDKTAHSAQSYLGACASAMKQRPNPYSLIAYESGMLIAEALSVSETEGVAFNNALRCCRMNGPRGGTSFLPNNPVAESRLEFTLSCTQQGTETDSYNHSQEHLQLPAICYQQMNELSQSEEYPGWINPYLIV
ncbi:MAG TPA: hypothetical protein ENJ32_09985 [Crenotrichaceae bacterium]|nr:hypothetical protein [Crenotrichaceae bacterium]